MGIPQTTAQYRLNYLWNTKIEIAKAINEVGKNKGISVNPRQDFAKFAEKILKLQTSVWSSAFIQVEPVGNENPRAEHWFEYIDEYFQPSEDITVDPSKQYYKQPPHSLIITENGYYKVSDLSLREFGEADAKTVASSFYVSVQSAPIIIGNSVLEYGSITNKGIKTPEYDFDEEFVGDNVASIVSQLVSRLGIVLGAQAVRNENGWTVTFDNGKVMIFSDTGTITNTYGTQLGLIYISGPPGTKTIVRIIKNTKAIFMTMTDDYSQSKTFRTFILATTDNGEDASWIHLGEGDGDIGWGSSGKFYAMLNGSLIPVELNNPLFVPFNGYRHDVYDDDCNEYLMWSLLSIEDAHQGSNLEMCQVDFGENIFIGPKIGSSSTQMVPKSYTLNNSEFAALIDNSCLWQRL